jgi:hypothetical protein
MSARHARDGRGIAVLDNQLDAAYGCQSGRSKHLLGARPRGEVIANAAKFPLSSKARFVTDCICRFAGKVRLATVNHGRR